MSSSVTDLTDNGKYLNLFKLSALFLVSETYFKATYTEP